MSIGINKIADCKDRATAYSYLPEIKATYNEVGQIDSVATEFKPFEINCL